MYAYVDRQVGSLDPAAGLLVDSMRRWVTAAAARTCPPHAIGPAFHMLGALPAMPYFHMAMILINRDARQQVGFAPIHCPRVAEDEAILLSVLRSVADRRPDRTRTTLGLFVAEKAVEPLTATLTELVTRLERAGLALAPHRPEPG